ncbi:Fic family protein [Ruminococcaceae bacterium OttesenSCG-928-I18]|nr:Fic family protein [Ruminococcaceae bacterium OttesenSCG-928-I18]
MGEEMELKYLLERIDNNKNIINERRPLATDEVRELDAYYKVGTTYSSNALEGNSLTLTETKVLLEDGITVGGKPVKDFYEATGHANAYEYMLSVARSDGMVFTEEMICKLHHLFYSGIDSEQAGHYRKHQVFITGTEYVPPTAEEVSALMKDFVADLNNKRDSLHPVLFAAFAHKRLVDIHPFADGNGRTARLLMNLVFVNTGYCVASIPPVLRQEYISALVVAQREENPSDEPFNNLIAECELEAQRDYGRMFKIPLAKKQDKCEPEL